MARVLTSSRQHASMMSYIPAGQSGGQLSFSRFWCRSITSASDTPAQGSAAQLNISKRQ